MFEINLVRAEPRPQSIRWNGKVFFGQHIGLVCVVSLLCIGGLKWIRRTAWVHWGQRVEALRESQRQDQLTQVEVQTRQEKILQLEQQQVALDRKLAVFEKNSSEKSMALATVIFQLTQWNRGDVSLQRMQMAAGEMHLYASTTKMAAVQEFLKKLSSLGVFVDVRLKTSEATGSEPGAEGMPFEILAQFRENP